MSTIEAVRYDGGVCTALVQEQLRNQFAKDISHATPDELFRAVSGALRPQIVSGLLSTAARFRSADAKCLYYLSMEFLLGRSLSNNLHNLGLYESMDGALSGLGIRLADVLEVEP